MVEFVLGKRGPAMNRSIAAALLAVVALSLAGCDEAPTKTEVAQSPKPAQSEAAKSFATAYAAIQREDYATALPILKELEAQGNASAQFYLGKMYLYGYGVERDYATALPILKELEAQGNATAQYNLGEMYRQGQGVAQDYKEAVRLYGLAAAQGDARAQYNLGVMYATGRGVAKDNVRAHMWYNITAILDTSVEQIASERRRDRELDDMTPAQIAEAQEMARKCQASNFKQCD